MLSCIYIENLFGNRNIRLEFNRDLTIIIGANGSGKTTLLNIINSIINENYEVLLKYKFDKIFIMINKKSMLFVKKENKIFATKDKNLFDILIKESEDSLIKWKNNIIVINSKDEYKENEYLYNLRNSMRKYEVQNLYFPTYRRSEIELTNLLFNDNYDARYYINDNRMNYLKRLDNTVVGMDNKDIEEIIKYKWGNVDRAESRILNLFISEMFLSFLDTKFDASHAIDDVDLDEVNIKMKEIFNRIKISKDMDHTYKTIDSYTSDLQSIQNLRFLVNETLKNYDSIELLDDILKDTETRRYMSYSLGNIFKIIKLYEEACESIENLKKPFEKYEDILNKFLYPKKAKVSNGILNFSYDNDTFTFDDLSAGEKQLVTLFTYISFGVKENGIVMIDELEISLDINWQRKIVDKLIEIRRDIQFIISTHSPSVSGNHRKSIVRIGDR